MNARTSEGTQTSGISLDAQLAELLETVWACERLWAIDDHVDAAIKYGRR